MGVEPGYTTLHVITGIPGPCHLHAHANGVTSNGVHVPCRGAVRRGDVIGCLHGGAWQRAR